MDSSRIILWSTTAEHFKSKQVILNFSSSKARNIAWYLVSSLIAWLNYIKSQCGFPFQAEAHIYIIRKASAWVFLYLSTTHVSETSCVLKSLKEWESSCLVPSAQKSQTVVCVVIVYGQAGLLFLSVSVHRPKLWKKVHIAM